MKKLLLIALLLAGCASSTRYTIECPNSPTPYNYKGWTKCPPPDKNGVVVGVKTRWGFKTFMVTECSDCRVRVWKRIKVQE